MKHPLRTLLLAVCCGLAAACTQRQERLKLMSYNIRNGIGIDNIQDIGPLSYEFTACFVPFYFDILKQEHSASAKCSCLANKK